MEYFLTAALIVSHPMNLLSIFVGTFFGLVFGAIPGLTATMGVALLIPFTFKMDPITGICLLIGIFIGGISGGLISATLLRMPGTPSSVATCFDGYPMAQKGQAGQALGIGIVSSFLAGLSTAVGLALLSPPIARLALHLGYFEYFSLGLFALTIVVTLSKGGMIKGILCAFLGLVISMFGTAPIDNAARFTFGWDEMKAGFSLLPVLIGLFAVSQIITELLKSEKIMIPQIGRQRILPPLSLFRDEWKNLIRSTFIGFFIGILPGIGGATGNIVAYAQAKSASKTPEKFGTGHPGGIVASESANNATTGGALIPLVTLGIPGDAVTAILIGGLMIHGIQPGPMLFKSNPDVVYSIFVATFIANIMMVLLMLGAIRVFIFLLKIPKTYLLPLIMALCVIGAFAMNNRMFDIWTLFLFGIVGFVLERFQFPLTPVLLGIVLEPIIEINLREGLMASQGDFFPIFTQPISLLFILLAVLSVLVPFVWRREKSG